ncbi:MULTISPECIES: SRPBCC domain-containing protein [unclassified Paenibacillus]|uniref:SRPBCC domain-containing protein n=1 Tax=unclassified Paenibacillus TaxID=185978 RepID=UPI00020D71CB|nr:MULTISPECIES: SRPBCC domain-containing protein [unclassified Paenibacillus]EGL19993.1 hypothetical protein HMPREF9413_1825 [Paenibacillus sp. HGF7]EPD88472.1 hypothetical protein HMPREF1207_02297 [Paenibacillus sp. HGH0039]
MDLIYHFYIDGSPEQVWDVFVTPEKTRKIFFDCVIDSSYVPGESIRYIGPGNDGEQTVHIYGEVLEYEPNRILSYTEHPGPSYYPNHAEITTRVTIKLEPVGGCTKLTLINDEWVDNHPSYEKADPAWWMLLSAIKTFVETGKKLDLGW